jgi:hypothetical protein
MEFSQIQHEILIGGLLGDLSIEKRSLNARFKIERSTKDLKYLQWQFDQFKNYCKKINIYDRYDKRYDSTHSYCYIRSCADSELNQYHSDWYQPKKIVPRNFELTPLILAIWFADDGCMTKYSENHYVVKFSTEGFLPEDTEYLKDMLCKYTNSKFYMYLKKQNTNNYIIKGSADSANSVMSIIKTHLSTIGMERKIKNIELNSNYKQQYKIFHELNILNCWVRIKQLSVKSSTITPIFKAAEKYGLIEKRPLKSDLRIKEYRLTDLGRESLESDNVRIFSKKG